MEGQTETTEPTSPATSGVAPLADAILAAVKTRAEIDRAAQASEVGGAIVAQVWPFLQSGTRAALLKVAMDEFGAEMDRLGLTAEEKENIARAAAAMHTPSE